MRTDTFKPCNLLDLIYIYLLKQKYKKIITMQCLFYLNLQPVSCMFYLELVPQEYVGADCITVDLLKDIDDPTDA